MGETTTNTNISISNNSLLILNGNVNIKSLNLNGGLILNAGVRGNIIIENLSIENESFKVIPYKESQLEFKGIDINDKIKKWNFRRLECYELYIEKGREIINQENESE